MESSPVFCGGMRASASFDVEKLESRYHLSASSHVVVSRSQLLTAARGAAKPAATPSAGINQSTLVFSDAKTAGSSAPRLVEFTNSGTASITLNSLTLSGSNATDFALVSPPANGTIVAPGGSVPISVKFTASTSTASVTLRTAAVTIADSDPAAPTLTLNLRALALTGYQGGPEPTLANLMTLYQLPINVGSTALNIPYTLTGTTTNLLGDEVVAQRLERATPAPVTVEPIATFGPAGSPDYTWGYYSPGNTNAATAVFTAETPAGSPSGGDGQTVNPIPTAVGGATVSNGDTVSFDPGAGAFGIYGNFTGTSPQLTAYSEDPLNTITVGGANKTRRTRFWAYKNQDGTIVPNAYIASYEEATNNDLQDVVLIIRNVMLPPASVVARQLYYKGDKAMTTDTTGDSSIATNLNPLLPGQTGSTSTANISGFDKGINGIKVDLANGNGKALVASDFAFATSATGAPGSWVTGPSPTNIAVVPGGGINTSERVNLAWADNAIKNTWLRVTVNANTNTALATPDVFYYGNLAGDTNASGAVDLTDYLTLAANFHGTVGATGVSLGDFNGDGTVDLTDYLTLASNFHANLAFFLG